ncbi:MAG: hypothetical protein PHU31_06210 [Anaerotignum sp.]|nr:hypothetical protein [Anaerotignum sp.]
MDAVIQSYMEEAEELLQKQKNVLFGLKRNTHQLMLTNCSG